MKVITKEPFDGHGIGETLDVTDAQGRQLIEKKLAKKAEAPSNKMAQKSENKNAPTRAAGVARVASSSRAARVSPAKTSSKSATGARRTAAKKAPAKKAAKKTTRRRRGA